MEMRDSKRLGGVGACIEARITTQSTLWKSDQVNRFASSNLFRTRAIKNWQKRAAKTQEKLNDGRETVRVSRRVGED